MAAQPPPGAEDHRCHLLLGSFAMLVQVALAVAAVVTLIYKRHSERPRRPWIVWAFDTTKQAYAGVLQHMVNLLFGVYFAVDATASECAWYLINFSISVACGVVILYLVMKAYRSLVDRFGLHLLRSGEYGKPPSWKPWLAQLLVWGFLASGEKLLTGVAVILPLHSYLDTFAYWLEKPLVAYPHIELLLVMVVAPVLLNILFFWVIDNIIMKKRPESKIHDDSTFEGDSTPLLEDDYCCCPPSGRDSHEK